MNDTAGFQVRFLATILDVIIMSVTVGVLSYFLYGVAFQDELRWVEAIEPLYNLLLPVIWGGYTLGKRMTHIHIIKMTGEKITLWSMFLRYIVSGVVYGLTLGVAVIVSAFMVGIREDNRAIHDFIAGTRVVYDTKNDAESR
ncbi:RDD family protein [Virgibacillus halodenitrificans]|uniref:RDD family protein n=1 Tax=Virgibacillus halodenitrificans TaxID=1482 RepID=UPI00045C6AB5|nr:RDD family protein [Virgibacillus halodenitrificans]MCJ0932502.1 RDD family protein [Virgibacillus halodenitrificans]MEC2160158.1 RDD family protein [Virgibacillus halodenitrificans]WHX27876.1 RDD family protein [Virgibacillus halodenitrificans]CDQ35361.1 RDD family protein [Virgibacillus halodenitrificans]